MDLNFTAATLAAYERWAPLYPPEPHNPLMCVEQRAMVDRLPHMAGRRALDLACGSGRYARLLRAEPAADVVAVDFCAAMLARVSTARRVCGDMMRLPFGDRAFDVVISGLALGHATGVEAWMREVSRVLSAGGVLVYSDFHPEAARAGLPRAFKDENDRTWTVPHRCFEVKDQEAAAAAAGLTIETTTEIRVGFELREPFRGSAQFYRKWHGLPLVLVVRARK